MIRYDIRGRKIHVAKCWRCGHEVNVTDIMNIHMDGLVTTDTKNWNNPLNILNKISRCCSYPDYHFINLRELEE